MTQGPWHLQDVLESAAGARGGAAAAAGGGGMQPQGLGQRSPEVIHHLNGQFYLPIYYYTKKKLLILVVRVVS